MSGFRRALPRVTAVGAASLPLALAAAATTREDRERYLAALGSALESVDASRVRHGSGACEDWGAWPGSPGHGFSSGFDGSGARVAGGASVAEALCAALRGAVDLVCGAADAAARSSGLVALCATPLDRLVGDKETVMDNYENRIREMSAPEKVFQFFSSVTKEDGQQYMTICDFLRSITPFWSNGKVVDTSKFRFLPMADVDGDGLISFDEYIVFITLLSIPVPDFEVAFRMFDLDRNGVLDIKEFRRVLRIMREKNPYGQAQRTAGLENSGLVAHFFGPDGNGSLSFEKFSEFLHGLRREILEAEFEHVARGREMISAAEFGRFVVSYTRTRYLNRLQNRLEAMHLDGELSFADFRNFHLLLERIDTLETAMNLMLKKGEGFSKDDFSRAAEVVVGVPQNPLVIDTIYHIFDDNDDDHLSPDEFISVMRYTSTLGLQKPRDTGFTRAFSRAWQCFKEEI